MTPISVRSPECLLQNLPFPWLMTSWVRKAPSLLPSWVHPFRCQEKYLTSLSLEQPKHQQSWVEAISLRFILPEDRGEELEKASGRKCRLKHPAGQKATPPRLMVLEAIPTVFSTLVIRRRISWFLMQMLTDYESPGGAAKSYAGFVGIHKGHSWQTWMCGCRKSEIQCGSRAQHPSYQNLSGMMLSIALLCESNGGWLHSLTAKCGSVIITWFPWQQKSFIFFFFCEKEIRANSSLQGMTTYIWYIHKKETKYHQSIKTSCWGWRDGWSEPAKPLPH